MAARRRSSRPRAVRSRRLESSSRALARTYAKLVEALEALEARFCLVGGLAVSARSKVRVTHDIDFALKTETDAEVERLVLGLHGRGFVVRELFERTDGTIATIRLSLAGKALRADLLVRTSGLEPEVVDGASRVESGVTGDVPVASRVHLLAMKVVAGRAKDLVDIEELLPFTTAAELTTVEPLLRLAERRQSKTGLVRRWRAILKRFTPPPTSSPERLRRLLSK